MDYESLRVINFVFASTGTVHKDSLSEIRQDISKLSETIRVPKAMNDIAVRVDFYDRHLVMLNKFLRATKILKLFSVSVEYVNFTLVRDISETFNIVRMLLRKFSAPLIYVKVNVYVPIVT